MRIRIGQFGCIEKRTLLRVLLPGVALLISLLKFRQRKSRMSYIFLPLDHFPQPGEGPVGIVAQDGFQGFDHGFIDRQDLIPQPEVDLD